MKKKILIIDDDSALRKVTRRALEEAGYEVAEVGDGADAVDAVRKHRPAVVLLDIHMPRIDGIAALEDILKVDWSIAVIVVSGDSARAQLAMSRGARDFISKPFDFGRLEAAVRACILPRS